MSDEEKVGLEYAIRLIDRFRDNPDADWEIRRTWLKLASEWCLEAADEVEAKGKARK